MSHTVSKVLWFVLPVKIDMSGLLDKREKHTITRFFLNTQTWSFLQLTLAILTISDRVLKMQGHEIEASKHENIHELAVENKV